MQFPCMRIAIYVLTFLTNAETIFGVKVLKNLISVGQNIHKVPGIIDEAVHGVYRCVYKCPQGAERSEIRPVKNKQHTPSTDGCGSQGLRIDTEFLPTAEMEICCNAHDICYGTCNSDKLRCDLDFRRCLLQRCERYWKSSNRIIRKVSCAPASKMLFATTLTLGCKAYLDAQKHSCYCAPPKAANGTAFEFHWKFRL